MRGLIRGNPGSKGVGNGTLSRKKSAEVIVLGETLERTERILSITIKKGESMWREQKITKVSCPGEGRLEAESTRGARSMGALGGGAMDNEARDLMERVLEANNLNRAYLRVKSNKGAPGVDQMTVEAMLPYLETHRDELIGRIRNGKYKPKPVRRVEIPKDGGKGVRLLGIPTAIDRLVQQAVAQVLTPIFEPTFSNSSFGFRPGRCAQDAVQKALDYYNEGYTHVVDIDLAKFFDTLNHDILIGLLREQIEDKRVIALIRKYLNSGVMSEDLVNPTDEGVPQGGPLSSLLSNIYLTKFDRMLEERGLRFVRYADDCNIYLKSERAAERVMKSVTKYLEGVLKLKVNQDKSQVGSPVRLKFLGFALWHIGRKTGIRAHEKSLKRFKQRVVQITRRNRGRSVKDITAELERFTRGWLGYFRIASLKSHLTKLDGWIRARLRMFIWKQWKRVKTKYKNLRKYGRPREEAWKWANTRKGYWRIAHSQVLATTLTNEVIRNQGYDELLPRYMSLNETLKLRIA